MSYSPCRACDASGTVDGEDCKECGCSGVAWYEDEDYSMLNEENARDAFDIDQIDVFEGE